jgi:serine/threonine protein kinase
MLIVRCTAKLLTRLKVRPEAASTSSTTRLGDWYATILPVRPAHLVLLVNEGTRLAVLLPAREISTLSKRIPEAILELCGSSVRQRSFWSPVAAGVEATHDAGVVHRDLKPGLAAVDHRSHAQDHLAVTRNQNLLHPVVWRRPTSHRTLPAVARTTDLGRSAQQRREQ